MVAVDEAVWRAGSVAGWDCDGSVVAGTERACSVDCLVEQALSNIEVKSMGSRQRLISLN